MARVPDAEIERLKAGVPLAALAEAAGVVLARTGADLTGRCPFHEDDTPSLANSPGKNLWHCMGACQAGGSVIDWVMRAEGVSFRHAVELLRDGPPAAAAGPGAAPKRSTVRKLAPPVELTAADHELLGQVTGYYHKVLKESPDVLGYLARRRIDHPEAIGTFRLGYADRTLRLRLPDKRRKDGAEIRGRLEKLGIFRASGHEHLAGNRRAMLGFLAAWLAERGITRPAEVTRRCWSPTSGACSITGRRTGTRCRSGRSPSGCSRSGRSASGPPWAATCCTTRRRRSSCRRRSGGCPARR